ncbi:transcriptional regulator [Paenibacillus sp. TRM 82003]|uniref:sugar-binding transcriptional regulator n=1 Tax=Kineococcus sp. TRM81007 TaxID=2925831 RepID=UPI001F573EEB|nr:sugar-binding domain-containing protein [Kineococcus sp. TRM81007]MCI2238023.1 transcriptional regulator [Kineococcus sp. TRM81007]MCI3926037.1 transcriptional regulator [Paenibacillus sp. TRM 82003]
MAKAPARGASTSGLALAAAVAQRFHVEGQTKVDIARDLGISRFKVARLLADATDAGLVQIRVLVPPSLDGELGEALRARFGLRAAYVVRADGEPVTAQRRAVAQLTAGLLEETVLPEDVVGLAWGRTVSQLVAALSTPLRTRFVQLAGALPRPDVEGSAVDLVRRAAEATGSTAATFYAPLAVPDAATADSLRSQPEIARALAELDTLTRAVVSVGAWLPGESTALDSLDDGTAARLARAGAVAEITGVLVGVDGGEVTGLADRVIGVTGEQLRRAGDVLAMACGQGRVPATAAVLRSGLVSTLVTHAELARELLRLP